MNLSHSHVHVHCPLARGSVVSLLHKGTGAQRDKGIALISGNPGSAGGRSPVPVHWPAVPAAAAVLLMVHLCGRTGSSQGRVVATAIYPHAPGPPSPLLAGSMLSVNIMTLGLSLLCVPFLSKCSSCV